MNESRTQKSMSNAFTGVIYKLVGVFFPFLIRTVMIKELGDEYLGLSNLFTSILQVLSLSELGIGSAMVYSMYKPMAENDTPRVCALLTLYRKLYRIIGIVILCLGTILSPFLGYFIEGGYPSDINIYLLYYIYLFNTVISYFLFAYKKSILDALQKASIENVIHAVIMAIMYIAQMISLIVTQNYYIYIIWLPLSTITINLYRSYIIAKKYPQYVCYGSVGKGFVRELYSKIMALLGHKIGASVLWFSDSIIISAFLGLHTLAVYSNYYYIMNAVIGLIAIIYSSVLASVGNSLVTETTEKNHNDFLVLSFGNNWLVSWCTICLICLYQPFMEIWMGESMMFSNKLVLLFGLYFYSWMFNKIGNTYKNAAGMWKEDFWKPYVSSISNLILNIVLVNTIGIAGVLISTIFASLVVETPWETYVLYKYLFKKNPFCYIRQLIIGSLITIAIASIVYVICCLLPITSPIVALLIRGAICIVLPNLLWILIYCKNPQMRLLTDKFTQIIKSVIKRRRKA